MDKRHRYIVTSAFRAICSNKLRYLGSASSKATASYIATSERNRGGRALVIDRDTNIVLRDTGKPFGQVWAGPSRKGQQAPAYHTESVVE